MKPHPIIQFYLILLLVSCAIVPLNSTIAQDIPRIQVSGYIVDAETNEPLPYANVFISNTTLGAAANQNGYYLIERVPLGNYELVASVIGYELKTINIQLTKPKNVVFNFRLKQKPIQAPDLSVSATVPKEWKENLEKFTRYFLGESDNAANCIILNPEILDLQIDPITKELKASASQTIEIENKALGYLIHCYLIDFSFRDYWDGRYSCKPQFESLHADNDSEKEEWKKNRLEAYHGSLRHFFSSLIFAAHKQNGFLVNIVEDPTESKNSGYFSTIEAEDILSPGTLYFEKVLKFHDFLEVTYTKETVPENFSLYEMYNGHGQKSWLKMENDITLTINELGNINNPYGLRLYGFWGWVRFADALPMDYTPKSENDKVTR